MNALRVLYYSLYGLGVYLRREKKKKNIVLEKLLVEDYAAEGKSLARVDGKVIFIENVVPGDVVDVRLLKNKRLGRRGAVTDSFLFCRPSTAVLLSFRCLRWLPVANASL